MLWVNEDGPEESKRLVIPGQEACLMVSPRGREVGDDWGGTWSKEGGLHFQDFCLLSEMVCEVFS